ncbi:MAG: hypothetical protein WD276_09340 [Actinomycetota bacterium]
MKLLSRRRASVLLVGAAALGVTVILLTRSQAESASPRTYEETRNLQGSELAQALGLTPTPYEGDVIPGEIYAACPDYGAVIGDPDKKVAYCTAKVSNNSAEGMLKSWDIAERIAGRVPSDRELLVMSKGFQADILSEQGDVAGASELRSEAHDIVIGRSTG